MIFTTRVVKLRAKYAPSTATEPSAGEAPAQDLPDSSHSLEVLPLLRLSSLVRHYAEEFEGLYEGEEFLQVVAEASEQSVETVRKILQP